jgi:hypothetical protein
MRLRYDDNIHFTVDNEEDDLVRYLTADAAFGVRTELSDVKFTLRLDDTNYRDNSEKDNSGHLLKLDSAYKLGRSLFRMNGAYEVDSTLTSELETTGYVQEHKRRVKKSLSPSWSYNLTERASTQLGYSYTDVTYEDAELTSLSGYRYDTLYASLTYLLSELSQISVTAIASDYEADRTGMEYDTRGLRLGFVSQLSETLSTSLSVGMDRSSSELTGAESTSDTGLTLDLSLQKSWEISSLRGTLSMSESPSGDGMRHTTKLGINYNRKLSPRTTFSVNTSLVENSSGGGRDDDSDDRRYVTFEPKLSWKATRWWTLSTSYRYRAQEYTASNDGVARSNAVFFNLSYVWPRENLRSWQQF